MVKKNINPSNDNVTMTNKNMVLIFIHYYVHDEQGFRTIVPNPSFANNLELRVRCSFDRVLTLDFLSYKFP